MKQVIVPRQKIVTINNFCVIFLLLRQTFLFFTFKLQLLNIVRTYNTWTHKTIDLIDPYFSILFLHHAALCPQGSPRDKEPSGEHDPQQDQVGDVDADNRGVGGGAHTAAIPLIFPFRECHLPQVPVQDSVKSLYLYTLILRGRGQVQREEVLNNFWGG